MKVDRDIEDYNFLWRTVKDDGRISEIRRKNLSNINGQQSNGSRRRADQRKEWRVGKDYEGEVSSQFFQKGTTKDLRTCVPGSTQFSR
ncbi:hypothetical protein WN55_10535 [Dufourea novaeangliae]|uniref:Uncharacterized protein n=1 Tax=Dufourea novaeangliae TaxID=178035 RepID=A0A154P5K9_DUFNO|nr:hypothetical protein WN55_10535 [Dufourea novaeangliae]